MIIEQKEPLSKSRISIKSWCEVIIEKNLIKINVLDKKNHQFKPEIVV